MDEYDEPITLELRDEREVAVMIFSLGVGCTHLLELGKGSGAVAGGNIQSRIVSEEDAERVLDALETYDMGAAMLGEGQMSDQAAIAKLREREEVDPDSFDDGSL